MEMMNETENYVYSALTKEYGDNWDAMDKDIVLEKKTGL